ncbi:DEAD/DEAH box helicase family protein [Tuwongella immobilis]|uniref:DEAD/DEAH box helicase family protein n=1 Tax=Tuwongella immobilis TaxID=692036 RepID=UPI001E35D99C|nr:DEAD/DEAH box helicase family protein [Tuwongella immobilis]
MAALRVVRELERLGREATDAEQRILARFSGFGAVALSLFPDPLSGVYKPGWRELGEELTQLLSPEEYASARRTVFTAFYTSPIVIEAIYGILARLGVPSDARILEPGCGSGHFLAQAGSAMQVVGIEQDAVSARIARARFPRQVIRHEDFTTSRLQPEFDAVIGNVPFADIRHEYRGQKLGLHDFFLAKSADLLKPGGVLAVITSHYTLDKQNAAARELLAESCDFVGAIRLPSDAFKREGTAVVTDLLILRRRHREQAAVHASPNWVETGELSLGERTVIINRYFLDHPQMVLGQFSAKDTLYGNSGYSLTSTGDLRDQLRSVIALLPERRPPPATRESAPPVTREPAPPATRETASPAVRKAEFVPPPLLRHLVEGSFFIGDDRRIRQIQAGIGTTVAYGGTELRSDGTLIGKRIAGLIRLRDQARRVLQSQNDGWPTEHREAARRDLNREYDRFLAAYGPINKTTFSTSGDGNSIRRMPNLVKFREDPDAMLVMALEEYDEDTATAVKAPILRRDVVGRAEPITRVATAEDGLLVCLDRTGRVDLRLISELWGQSEAAVLRELGELVYRDPGTDAWETADAYLSGNVRAKLQIAEAAGLEFARNVAALQRVQPEDVLPGDIDANLGAPWIPTSDIEAFAADLFGVRIGSIQIAHLEKDAFWSVEPDSAAERSVAATADYGTARANGNWLLELALNMKTPVIYDPDPIDPEKRVVNADASLAAREKQRQIREKFRDWLFAEADRTERLVRIYNDAYNNLRLRQFDGSHLAFPGMTDGIALRSHQVDAVWRAMTGGNTLLAHCVGAGKTFTMAAAGMKMRQAGIIRKPMFVVPNHMLEQFSREFLQLYPNAHLLLAAKEDLSRDRRKMLTARIASGDWDGIIVTHSSFERIGMSQAYQADFLRHQIEEYDELLKDRGRVNANRAQRNILKSLEKQKARREAKLLEMLAGDKKDDGLVFDELGVDYLFIDEAHSFKNLETPTKMDRVAGIQTGGSERAFDLFMKARFLDSRHPGRGLCFATGTPISNTMVELYTLQRYLDPAGLKSRGIEHFDAWAATFGEVVETMEISPDGQSLKSRSRFAKFVNLPELQQMFRSFADVQTAEMLDLPRPQLEGGKAQIVSCPMSPAQAEIQQDLVARYEKIRSQKVDPRLDNALAITTDGRKLALDARMLEATADDFPESKVNALVRSVAEIWQRTTSLRGTQMIFCDLGVEPTAWGFSAYAEVTRRLINRGVPVGEIAAVGDADSDAKKQALFDQVRAGSVRILLGSTAKMGAGTNVQKRLIALHHLDAPWKPAEVEQREGRILRQGNSNDTVAIYRYVTAASFDAYMWQALETKARFITQVMTGEVNVRRAEDVAGQELSYAEVKAIASGNPAVLTLAEADAELQRLSVLRKNHADEQYTARRRIQELPGMIARLDHSMDQLSIDLQTLRNHADDPIQIDGQPQAREQLLANLAAAIQELPEHGAVSGRFPLGIYRGLTFGLKRNLDRTADVYLQGATCREAMLSRESQGPRAVLHALARIVDHYAESLSKSRHDRQVFQTQLRDYQARVGVPFAHAAYLDQLTQLRDQLRHALAANPPISEASALPNSRPSAESLSAQIVALQAENRVSAKVTRQESSRSRGQSSAVTNRRPNASSPMVAEAVNDNAIVADAAPPECRSPVVAEDRTTGDAVAESNPGDSPSEIKPIPPRRLYQKSLF